MVQEIDNESPDEYTPDQPEEAQPVVGTKKSMVESIHDVVAAPGKPRQWLIDRCDGNERIMNPNSRPCAPCFNAPLPLKWMPDILEQNRTMECLGKIGLVSPTNNKARKFFMILALLSTILGWSCLIAADFAISTNYDFLQAVAFNYASIGVRNTLANRNNIEFTTLSVGLKAVAWTRSNATFDDTGSSNVLYSTEEEVLDTVVTTFDQFCSGTDAQLGLVLVDPERCNACEEASTGMVTSILMGTITYFFTFTTDVLRIWPNYDVNCQKVFGAFFAIISACLGLQTYFLYHNQCFASFNEGTFCYDVNRELTECSEDNPDFDIEVYFQWQAGNGLVLLGIATFAKILDLICNIIIPTPSITRDHDEQQEYEERFLAEQKKAEVMERGEDDAASQVEEEYKRILSSSREGNPREPSGGVEEE